MVRIALTTGGDAAEDIKRPTLSQIEKGKKSGASDEGRGLGLGRFRQGSGARRRRFPARWIKGIAFDPEDKAAKKVQKVQGHVFANPKEDAQFPYGLTVLSSRETLPDLKSLENVKSGDKWITGTVRLAEDGKVTKTFTASLLPNEPWSLSDKFAGREDFKALSEKGLPEKTRLDLVLFENHNLSKETFPKGDKWAESLAFRTVRAGNGETFRKPENRLSEMVVEFDPGSGKFVTGIHAMGPRLTPSYLVPVTPGEKLTWSPDKKESAATANDSAFESPKLPEAETAEPEPDLSLPGLSEPEPVGSTASLYNDDDLSMN
ncbi:MAG: hypothetical protein D084_Lepto4C00304G0001 [Leptospirillum sp. Group IV 'UBA BS']|nr:MAG: hypothetical protein D084_Lepto4C00304G0001 [Leptospirillum sp. Group IV 'UBA BS']